MGDVAANGVRLHYYRTGGDKPPLMLAHGYSDQALCWLRVARLLQRDYDVIMYDARGHGYSEAPSTVTLLDRAADMAWLISALDLNNPALLGHSMGAQTAAVCAGLYPELVRCALLEDPPWMEPEEAARRGRVRDAAWLEKERAHIIERNHRTLKAQVEIERGMNAEWTMVDLREAARARLLMSPHNAETIADPPPPWSQIAARIRCPVLLMTGDVGRGALVTPELAASALRLLPAGSKVANFESGHSIHRTAFTEFMSSVAAFLSEHCKNR